MTNLSSLGAPHAGGACGDLTPTTTELDDVQEVCSVRTMSGKSDHYAGPFDPRWEVRWQCLEFLSCSTPRIISPSRCSHAGGQPNEFNPSLGNPEHASEPFTIRLYDLLVVVTMAIQGCVVGSVIDLARWLKRRGGCPTFGFRRWVLLFLL